jgi:hypothetical protein
MRNFDAAWLVSRLAFAFAAFALGVAAVLMAWYPFILRAG